MHNTIDGIQADFSNEEMNVVQVAANAGIGIPAPCYKNGHKNGCCRVCVIEIDGKQAYACCTKPASGMTVIVNREDLIVLRKERLKDYEANDFKGFDCDCGCGSDNREGSCC